MWVDFVGVQSGLLLLCDANVESGALLLSDGGIGAEDSDALTIDELSDVPCTDEGTIFKNLEIASRLKDISHIFQSLILYSE